MENGRLIDCIGRLSLVASGCLAIAGRAALGSDGNMAQVKKDIEYAQIGDTRLVLDLYVPKCGAEKAEKPKLVIWIHGGAWRSGSRAGMPLEQLVDQGYAVASVDYRLTTVAPFPAQVHDIKAAIRFLRAEQGSFAVDARRAALV